MSALPVSLRTVAHPTSAQSGRGGSTAAVPASAHQLEDSIAARSTGSKPTLRDAARAQTAAVHEQTATFGGQTEPSGRSPGDERRAALVRTLLAKVPASDRESAKTAIPAILDAAQKTGTTDPNQLGYLLATAQTESDFGANMVENGHSKEWFNKNYGCEDGNRPGTDDGYTYRGRGYVQTTHAGRYAEISHDLGLPDVPVLRDGEPVLDGRGKPTMRPALVAHPEKLAEPKIAAQALVLGVTHNLFTHNAAAALDKTIPPGKQPGDADFYHARGIVNGIVKAQAQAVSHHATAYAQVFDSYRHSALGAPEAK